MDDILTEIPKILHFLYKSDNAIIIQYSTEGDCISYISKYEM